MTPDLTNARPQVDCTHAANDLISSSAEYLRQVNSYGKGVRMYVGLSQAIEGAKGSIRSLEDKKILAGLMRDQAAALTSLGLARGYLKHRRDELAAESRALLDTACTERTKAYRERACQRHELTMRYLAGRGLERYDAMLGATMS